MNGCFFHAKKLSNYFNQHLFKTQRLNKDADVLKDRNKYLPVRDP